MLFEQVCSLLADRFDLTTLFITLAQLHGTTRVEYALDRFRITRIEPNTTESRVRAESGLVVHLVADNAGLFDRFKIVNDPLGHAVRIGGDEFVIVLHHLEDGAYVRLVAQRTFERMGIDQNRPQLRCRNDAATGGIRDRS